MRVNQHRFTSELTISHRKLKTPFSKFAEAVPQVILDRKTRFIQHIMTSLGCGYAATVNLANIIRALLAARLTVAGQFLCLVLAKRLPCRKRRRQPGRSLILFHADVSPNGIATPEVPNPGILPPGLWKVTARCSAAVLRLQQVVIHRTEQNAMCKKRLLILLTSVVGALWANNAAIPVNAAFFLTAGYPVPEDRRG